MVSDFYHIPVMLQECLDGLNITPEGVYVDCTLGGGGHSFAIANILNENGSLHSFDRDLEAVSFARERLKGVKPAFTIHACPFSEIGRELSALKVDGILYDLGISSHQVDDNSRGFTFVGNNPLDLRMDTRESMSAQEFLFAISEDDLARVLRKNSDLDRAYKLAVRIVSVAQKAKNEERKILPEDLKLIVESVFPDKKRDTNSLLARVFQAIRMEVNGELLQIEESLKAAVEILKIGGRLVVMSYHSVEDRCVKETLAAFEKDCICPEHLPVCTCGGNHRRLKKVNRKPILPTENEILKNSRARSAKLRVFERV